MRSHCSVEALCNYQVDEGIRVRLAIDKLQVRIDYSSSHSNEYQQLYEWFGSVRCKLFYGPPHPRGCLLPSHPSSSLSAAIQHLPGGGYLLVRYGKQQGRFRAWFEFNPSKANLVELAGHLNLLLDYGPLSLWQRGIVTRFEIAADVEHARFEDYAFLDTRLRSGTNLRKRGSEYLGCRKAGARHFICYDKRREMVKHLNLPDIGIDLLRIEARLQDRERFPFREMDRIKNPFRTLLVLDRHVLHDSEHEGVALAGQLSLGDASISTQEYFGHLDAKTRKQVATDASKLQADWWNGDEVWKQYPAALGWVPELITNGCYSLPQELAPSTAGVIAIDCNAPIQCIEPAIGWLGKGVADGLGALPPPVSGYPNACS